MLIGLHLATLIIALQHPLNLLDTASFETHSRALSLAPHTYYGAKGRAARKKVFNYA